MQVRRTTHTGTPSMSFYWVRHRQLSMPATRVNGKRANAVMARRAGGYAYESGRSISLNPYIGQKAEMWREGWRMSAERAERRRGRAA